MAAALTIDDPPSDVPPSPRARGLRRLEPTSDAAWSRLAAIVLAVASVLLVGSYLHGAPKLSPIDELQHFDYVVKAPHIPRAGEAVGQEALRTEACRGLDYPVTLPECGAASYNPLDFQENGRSTASIHPPPYYYLTAAVARPLSALTGASLYACARAVGALWLLAGLWMTWCLGRRLGAPPAGLLGILLLVASTPWVWISSGNITPDATALLVGAGTVWLAIRWEAPRARIAAVAAAALLSVMFKANHIIALAPVCTYLLADAALTYRDARARRREAAAGDHSEAPSRRSASLPVLLAAPLIAAAVAGILVVAWNSTVNARTLPGTQMDSIFPAGHVRLNDILISWQSFLPPIGSLPWPTPIIGNHPGMRLVTMLLASLLVLSCIYVALVSSFARRLRLIAGSLLIWMVLGGPLYTLATVVLVQQKFTLPPRYGLALVAPLAVIAAVSITHRRMQMVLLASGLLYVLYTVGISFRQQMLLV